MIFTEGDLLGRVQTWLDVRSHGLVRWNSFHVGEHGYAGFRRHADGFEREYRTSAPPALRQCPQCLSETRLPGDKVCSHCRGQNRLTTRQALYLASARRVFDETRSMPHCDGNVLHALGSCWACDLDAYRGLHVLRQTFRISYSDAESADDWDPCPSTAWRDPAKINRWGGNTARKENA